MSKEDFINSFKLLSHTEPYRKLVIHFKMVYERAKSRYDEINVNFEYLNISKDEFEKILKITCLCHDFGKASNYFQEKLSKDKLTVEEKSLSEHGLISAFFGFFIASEIFGFDKRLSSFVFMAIRHHHLNLENAYEMQEVDEIKIEHVLKIFQGIKNNKNEIHRIYMQFFGIENITERFENFLENNFNKEIVGILNPVFFWYEDEYKENDIFVFMLLFSLLIWADKEDAIFRDKKIEKINIEIDSEKVEEFKENYFQTKEKTPLDETREKIYQSIVKEFEDIDLREKDIYFIKLPTGAGKTLLLYKLAMKIKEQKKDAKVFYLLPFITLIEQNSSILQGLLEFMGIDSKDNRIFLEKHSLSGEFEINENSKEEYDIDKKQFLLDTLDSEFVVTSFHQLFYGVFKRKNALLKRFHQFANSIILIDEVQLIPLKHMYIITRFLQFMSEIFNCKIIVASATFPNIKKEILSNSYEFKGIDKILEISEIDKFFNRYKIKIDIDTTYKNETLFEKINQKLETKRDLLFRVNTVNIANEIYEYLMRIDSDYEKENIFLLTSAVAPIIRKRIISKIKENSKNGIKQIVVATQLIQAGVDISLEDGFEELAPFDLIVQSMGRRNRSAEKGDIGRADIIKIAREINDKDFEGYRIYNQFDIEQTIKILQRYEALSEKEIYEFGLLDEYYNAQVDKIDIDVDFLKLNFKNIDEKFKLIEEAPLSFSFFLPLDDKANSLWKQLKELDKRKKEIKKDKNFWKNMREIESKYSKIKKDVALYTVNQNFYYQNAKKETLINIIIGNFENALGIYLATEDIFDEKIGLKLTSYVKDKIEGLFW